MKKLFNLLVCLLLTCTFSVGFASNEKTEKIEHDTISVVDSVEVAEVEVNALHLEVGWYSLVAITAYKDTTVYNCKLPSPIYRDRFIYTLSTNTNKHSKKWVHCNQI